MSHPAPNPAGTSAAHWQAAREGSLALPYCAACQSFLWPARARCPQCRGPLAWRHAAGRGRVAAFSVVRRAVNAERADDPPYVVAFVELDEGVRLFTNIVAVDPHAVRMGMRVRCRFEPALDPALQIPVFEPESATIGRTFVMTAHKSLTPHPSPSGRGVGRAESGMKATFRNADD